jgi:hypothetical protein
MTRHLRAVPTNTERRDYFDRAGTSVAEQVRKEPTRLDMALAWAAYAALQGLYRLGWILQKVRR